MKKGFTLIEVLTVVGIIAILTIAILFLANFQESQRRSRDATRLQDMAKLAGVIEAYLGDNGLPPISGVTSIDHASYAKRKSLPCDNSWIPLNLCPYIRQIPLDPRNYVQTTFKNDPGAAFPNTGTFGAYSFAVDLSTGNFEFCTRLEAENSRFLLNDNGNTPNVFEAGSNTQAVTCPAP